MRIALYSHDALGLGHVRRNLAIAHALAALGRGATLLITGAREAGVFSMPAGTDCLALPALNKSDDGRYRSRSLGLSLDELLELRAETISSALSSFEPDVMIVDKHPHGLRQELRPALDLLGTSGRTRLVLGLRDVLDAPATLCRDWSRSGDEEAVRERYDAVWVYGDPRTYDLVSECSLHPEVARKVRYSGYLAGRPAADTASSECAETVRVLGLARARFSLCLVGGGQDGFRLAEAFAAATLPAGTEGVILTGPFMPPANRQRLMRRAKARKDMHVVKFVSDPTCLIRLASSVVAMGGYNTVCELLSAEKRALVVPRVRPRSEQLIRAERMSRLGLFDMLHPDELSPGAVSTWLAGSPAQQMNARDYVDLNGLSRLRGLLGELLDSTEVSAEARQLEHVAV